MKPARLLLVLLSLLTVRAARAQEENKPVKPPESFLEMHKKLFPLKTTQLVRALGGGGADQLRISVRLTGVVTLCDERRGNLFLQDNTGGIHVELPVGAVEKPQPGAKITVEGVTAGGMYGARVRASKVVISGTAPFPAPVAAKCQELTDSRWFGQWVELEGTVLDYVIRDGLHILELTANDQYALVIVHGSSAERLRQGMVNARIKIRGVNWRHRDGVLQAPDFSHLTVVQPGYDSVFDVPGSTVEELRAAPPDSGIRRRCKAVGRFVHNGVSVFLTDGTTPFLAQLHSLLNHDGLPDSDVAGVPPYFKPEPGDEIEVVGTLFQTGPLLEMRACCCRVLRKEQPLPPVMQIGGEDMAAGRHQAAWVTVRGTLVKTLQARRDAGMETTLTFDAGGVVYSAYLCSPAPSGLVSLPLDHVIECTGCYTNLPAGAGVTRFLYLPSADAVRVIRPSPGIITRRIWQGVAVAGVL